MKIFPYIFFIIFIQHVSYNMMSRYAWENEEEILPDSQQASCCCPCFGQLKHKFCCHYSCCQALINALMAGNLSTIDSHLTTHNATHYIPRLYTQNSKIRFNILSFALQYQANNTHFIVWLINKLLQKRFSLQIACQEILSTNSRTLINRFTQEFPQILNTHPELIQPCLNPQLPTHSRFQCTNLPGQINQDGDEDAEDLTKIECDHIHKRNLTYKWARESSGQLEYLMPLPGDEKYFVKPCAEKYSFIKPAEKYHTESANIDAKEKVPVRKNRSYSRSNP